MKCIICLDTTNNKLTCNHNVHMDCLMKWSDTLQKQLSKTIYPLLKFARCPFCNEEQLDIPLVVPKWYGKIIIDSKDIVKIINNIYEYKGLIPVNQIPKNILEQMNNSSDEDKWNVINTLACIIWTKSTSIKHIPKNIILYRNQNGLFKTRVILKN